MNKSRKILATLLALIITTMTVAPAFTAPAPLPPAIWLEPTSINLSTASHSVGYKFNLTLWISTASVSYTWQAKVNFNPAHLQVTGSDYTGSGKSLFFTGLSTIPVTAIIDNVGGYIVCGESLIGAIQRSAGSTSLQWIEFQVVAVPGVDVTWNEQITVEGPAGGNTFILDPDLSTVAGLSVGSATYTFSPPPPVRDVAVTALSFSKDVPKFGDNITITVNALNNGTISETFEIRIAFDSTPIVTLNVVSLGAGAAKILTYEWNTSDGAVGKHNITASATVVPFDIDPDNNSKTKPITIMSTSGPMTDINGDGKVNMKDIAIVAQAFGTHEGDGRWNPLADVKGDGYVNLFDIALVAKDFWK